jgi:hypothetical protein
MASRDRNAEKFEEFIVDAIDQQNFAEQQTDKKSFIVECPCCETGTVQMEINTKFKTVLAECSNYGINGTCGSHKVSMNYKTPPRTRMVDNGIE